MTDSDYIERLFKRECSEKKRIAQGEKHHVKTQKGMKMPYEYLTAKEKRALNGECVSVKMDQPMLWPEFKKLSATVQKEYVENLVNKYGASFVEIINMFEISAQEFAQWRQNVGFRGKNGRKKFLEKEWNAFLGKEETPEPQKEALKIAKHVKITFEIEV